MFDAISQNLFKNQIRIRCAVKNGQTSPNEDYPAPIPFPLHTKKADTPKRIRLNFEN